MRSVDWSFDTFNNNFRINYKFTKYLKEICVLDFNKHFSSKDFLKDCFCLIDITKIGKLSWALTGMSWLMAGTYHMI